MKVVQKISKHVCSAVYGISVASLLLPNHIFLFCFASGSFVEVPESL